MPLALAVILEPRFIDLVAYSATITIIKDFIKHRIPNNEAVGMRFSNARRLTNYYIIHEKPANETKLFRIYLFT